ncbi:MAG: CAP domain-containing protein [Candidatus Dormibacteraceae bacterium]
MRFLSWLGVVGIVLALGWAATTVVHRNTNSARTLSASRNPVPVAGPFDDTEMNGPEHRRLMPSPSPTPPPPPPAAVAPAAAAPPVAAPVRAAAPRPPSIVVGSTQQALINQDRARNGLAPVTWNACLYRVAVSNAQRMAAQGFISHTNGPSADLSCGLSHQAGENVGDWSQGINDSQLNSMFINSPEHLANILGPYRYVATAWVVANGYGYIAVEFS